MTMTERWRDIEGFEGYQVSDHGRVMSLERPRIRMGKRHGTIGERVLKGTVNSVGYIVVNLRINGRTQMKTVHSLVAEAFIPNPEKKSTVNHIDGVKTHNHVDNLEWSTYSENNQHAWDIGLKRKGKSA